MADAFQLNGTSSPPPSPPLHGGEGDGLAASARFAPDAVAAKINHASNQENSLIDSQSSRANNAASVPSSTGLTKADSRSALDPGFITRPELKRELDSLRRLMESRK